MANIKLLLMRAAYTPIRLENAACELDKQRCYHSTKSGNGQSYHDDNQATPA